MKHSDLLSQINPADFVSGLEDRIPVSTDRQNSRKFSELAKRQVYPLHELKIGQSFTVRPFPGELLTICQNRLTTAVSSFKREFGGKFTTRQQQGEFVRCWRVA